MALLGFLKSSRVEEIVATPKAAVARPGKQRTPNPGILAIRIWKDGSVFPSQALADKFDLEYRTAVITKENLPLKDGETTPKTRNKYDFPNGTGNGFDVIDSREWFQFKGDGQMLFVSPVPKDSGKVDLFAQTSYEETGVPKTSVVDQGAATFGKDVLLPLIKEVYGIELSEEKEYVDLMVFESLDDFNLTETFSRPIMHFPKRITRGENKGKSDYVRRENAKVYGLAPVEMVQPGGNDETTAGEATTTPEVETVGTGETPATEPLDLTHATPAERKAYFETGAIPASIAVNA